MAFFMLKVGLTGGIGSGKSTVARIFESLGVPVFYADDASKLVMATDETVKRRLKQAFGARVYKDGELDRKYLAGIVFHDSGKLELLNSIVHPATIEFANQWISKQKAPYIIKEAALLFESGSYKSLDLIIGVSAPADIRILRVMQRDKVSKEEVEARMSKQMDEEEKISHCDIIIYNQNGERQSLEKQVLDTHEMLLKKANKPLS